MVVGGIELGVGREVSIFHFIIISIRNIKRGKKKTKKEILTGDIWAVAFSAVVLIIIFS